MRARLFPGGELLAARRLLATELWVRQPAWTYMSQGRPLEWGITFKRNF
ncbi:MAG TPA: hypothetical protein VMF03_06510 [Steroidobacteraceae bacterium]|nr:hypothetical protein [Steroidobacteraceae bacterium]